MSLNNSFRPILHVLYHQYLRNDNLYDLVRFYRATQYWSFEKIRDLQLSKLKELLVYCYDNVPYYRLLFKDIGLRSNEFGDLNSFQRIPFLTKDLIRKNQNLLVSSSIKRKYLVPNSTSGSTGTNLKFFSDRQSLHAQAMVFRNYDWMDIDYFDRKVTIWGASWDIKKSKELITRLKAKLKGNITLSGYQLSDNMLQQYSRLINDFYPQLLRSYPSILYTLADFYERFGIESRPFKIESAGEKLHSFQRDKIERVFNTRIFDFYGARDIPLIAQECEIHKGLHVMAENVFLEVVDENGNPIKDGEGDLVLTHLNNKAMPFIRYKIGDRVKISQRNCTCGRNLPLIDEVIGRTFEIIQFPNGNRVGGTFWTLVMKSAPGIKDFQIIQHSKDNITINFIPENTFKRNDLSLIENNVLKYSGPELQIDFKEMKYIPPSKAGKQRFILSEIKG